MTPILEIVSKRLKQFMLLLTIFKIFSNDFILFSNNCFVQAWAVLN